MYPILELQENLTWNEANTWLNKLNLTEQFKREGREIEENHRYVTYTYQHVEPM